LRHWSLMVDAQRSPVQAQGDSLVWTRQVP